VGPTGEKGYVVHGGIPGWGALQPDLEDNPELRFPSSVKVYSRMRREETQLQSVLRAVKLPIERTNWWLDARDVRPEVAEFVSRNLGLPLDGRSGESDRRRRKGRFSWHEHLRLALTHLDFGFAFFEQVYEYQEGMLWLRKLGERPQPTISFVEVDADGGLKLVTQKSASMKIDRLVAYVNEREGGNWFGVSLLRPSYKFWLLKDRLLRVQAISGDRNGLGIAVYTGAPRDEAADPEVQAEREKADLERGLKVAKASRSSEYAGAAVPHGASLDFKGVTGDLPDLDKPIRYYDEQMAQAALAHFLNLGKQTGSWALGTTFADFFALSLQTVALYVADVATQHIVEDLVDLNWGEEEPAPRVVFDEIGSQSPPTAEAMQSLVQTKVIRPDDTLEDFMRRRFGLPEADPSTVRDVGTPTPAPTPGQISAPRGNERSTCER